MYYQNSIINRYKYSDISEEAKSLTNALLKTTNHNPCKITKHIITYPSYKLGILTQILSNHNNLNYHMTRAKLRYDEYCEYCTEVMKHCDPNWNTNCLETAQHILCTCPYFNNIRNDLFNVYQIKNYHLHVMTKHFISLTDKIINFFDKTKTLNRTPKINKRDLSPDRIIKQGRKKRKNNINASTNANKRPQRI